MISPPLRFCLLILLLLPMWRGARANGPLRGEAAVLAVASNFTVPARALAADFERETSATLTFSFGATGKHFTQIVHGAPFDAFLAADGVRPRRLLEEGRAVAGSRFCYAVGRLVLWQPAAREDGEALATLRGGNFRHLALAEPSVAPYGAAAVEVLQHLGLREQTQGRWVRGENIAQAFQFVESGNAELGFVALAQVQALGPSRRGGAWLVPAELHTPVRQDAVLLRRNRAAEAFLEYLRRADVRQRIAGFGYDVPGNP